LVTKIALLANVECGQHVKGETFEVNIEATQNFNEGNNFNVENYNIVSFNCEYKVIRKSTLMNKKSCTQINS
jgi:hypothetical protein